MQSLKNKIYARKIAQECLSFSEYPIKWMNPKQFLVFYTVRIIWFFRIFNGTGSGGKVPTLLPDTDYNKAPKNGSGQEQNLPFEQVSHAEQSNLSMESAMHSGQSKSSNPEKSYEIISNGPQRSRLGRYFLLHFKLLRGEIGRKNKMKVRNWFETPSSIPIEFPKIGITQRVNNFPLPLKLFFQQNYFME